MNSFIKSKINKTLPKFQKMKETSPSYITYKTYKERFGFELDELVYHKKRNFYCHIRQLYTHECWIISERGNGYYVDYDEIRKLSSLEKVLE